MAEKSTWEVKIEDEAARIFESSHLTDEDKTVIQNWAILVRDKGPEALHNRPGVWADHPLYAEWAGHRASSFSHSGRIIYRIDEEAKRVIVAKITHDHNYKGVKR